MRFLFPAALAATLLFSTAASAQEGPVIITQAKALAGGITPQDAPGYPITIGKSGSYRLGSDLQPGTFLISSTNVTLDLDGFSLQVGGAADIAIQGGAYLTIKNGRIINPVRRGIQAGLWCKVENVSITGFPDGAGISCLEYGDISGVQLFSQDFRSAPSGFPNIGVICEVGCRIDRSIINARTSVDMKSGSVTNSVLASRIFRRGGTGERTGQQAGVIGAANNTLLSNGPIGTGGITPLDPNACLNGPC